MLATLAVACGDSDDDDAADVRQVYDITVTADGVEPAHLELRVPEKAQVVVTNDSDRACEFHFGPYVRGLSVPAGDSSTIAFTAIDPASVGAAEAAQLSMGCEGDERSGEIVLLTSTARN